MENEILYRSPNAKVIEMEMAGSLLSDSRKPNVNPGWGGGSDGDDDE